MDKRNYDFAKAMGMDVDDIKNKFGKKYDKYMKEFIIFAETKGNVATSEANKLRAKCK